MEKLSLSDVEAASWDDGEVEKQGGSSRQGRKGRLVEER